MIDYTNDDVTLSDACVTHLCHNVIQVSTQSHSVHLVFIMSSIELINPKAESVRRAAALQVWSSYLPYATI